MSKIVEVNKLKKGDYYAVCDVCGTKNWASTMKVRWDGAFVDDDCYEPYHEGDRSKVIKEDRMVPIARNRDIVAADNELATTPITSTSSNDGKWYVVE